MSARTSLARTGAFALLYLVATVAGRLTVMDHTNLSMVWPAAGVLVVWFCAQRAARWRWADVAALIVITLVVNTATGAGARLAVVFVVANVGQVWLFLKLFRYWQPQLWGAGGDQPLRRLRDLWSLLGAAAASTALGAALGTSGMWMITGHLSIPAAAVWLARNTASILLIGAVGITVGYAITHWRAGAGRTSWSTRTQHMRDHLTGARIAEYTALISCSVAAYTVGFAVNHGYPIAFALIAISVWAGLRTPTAFVAVHDLVLGTAAVLFTLHGTGPFAAVNSDAGRAMIAQLFVGIVAVVGLALALGRDERDALLQALRAEKAALAAQQQRTQRRAELLTAIVDSMADGLSVIDSHGRVIMRNDATVRLLGGQLSPGDQVAGSSHYGLFNLDGTPVTEDQTAYAQAIAGHGTIRREIIVRNPGVPEGRIVTVTATALTDEDGEPGVVLLMHDVTAERRHRDELASFAGVVAHDLQNPLTAVEGWIETAVDALDVAAATGGNDGLGLAQDSVSRAGRAAVRMRTLINDLLTYTTTRSATMRAEAVDLDNLVSDIAIARADAAVAARTPVPRFVLGTLPAVHADRPLLRQLLDNLIGNAIKYTGRGVTPELSISARLLGDERVEVTVADNGIGIPVGQHDAIFGNFHRAHTTDGYAGTGLGLTICKRIVERHGGTIRAEDNPTGGTRLVFTLPTTGAADQAPAPALSVGPTHSIA